MGPFPSWKRTASIFHRILYLPTMYNEPPCPMNRGGGVRTIWLVLSSANTQPMPMRAPVRTVYIDILESIGYFWGGCITKAIAFSDFVSAGGSKKISNFLLWPRPQILFSGSIIVDLPSRGPLYSLICLGAVSWGAGRGWYHVSLAMSNLSFHVSRFMMDLHQTTDEPPRPLCVMPSLHWNIWNDVFGEFDFSYLQISPPCFLFCFSFLLRIQSGFFIPPFTHPYINNFICLIWVCPLGCHRE